MEILYGLVSGIISGMGMGGGTILIFLLSFFSGFKQQYSQATNLIFFIPTSLVAIIINIYNKKINWKVVSVVVPFGIFGALFGSKIAIMTNQYVLRKFFFFFLVFIVFYEFIILFKRNDIKKY